MTKRNDHNINMRWGRHEVLTTRAPTIKTQETQALKKSFSVFVF
jgi:hypothetical protein